MFNGILMVPNTICLLFLLCNATSLLLFLFLITSIRYMAYIMDTNEEERVKVSFFIELFLCQFIMMYSWVLKNVHMFLPYYISHAEYLYFFLLVTFKMNANGQKFPCYYITNSLSLVIVGKNCRSG